MSDRFLLEWSVWGSWYDRGAEGECMELQGRVLKSSGILVHSRETIPRGVGDSGDRSIVVHLSPCVAFSHHLPHSWLCV